MRRKLFVKCTLLSLMISSLSFADAREATPQEALMLRRISEFWKDGDYATVKNQIVDFLAKHPESLLTDHLNAMLADIYFQEKNYKQALTIYDSITNLEIKKKILFNSLQARFEIKDYDGVIQHTTAYLETNQLGNDDAEVKIRRIFAEALFREAFLCKDLDKKTKLLKMAQPHYKILSQSKYGDKALFPLAEIHRLLKEEEQASDLYLLLAKKFPEHKERFLFQAAILQINFNKEEALHNFEKIYLMNGKRAELAAFNKLILLYNNEQFQEFLDFYEQVSQTISKEKAPLLKFYQGRSSYALRDYPNAMQALETFVNNPLNRSKEYKVALLLLINCSKFQKDLALLERTLNQFKTSFPNDPEIPKAIMMHAQLCREKGDIAASIKDLQFLLNEYPGNVENEAVLYDYALSLSKIKNWDDSCNSFVTFLRDYPSSPKATSATRHLINCYIEILKDSTRTDYQNVKENFVQLLVSSFKQENLLNREEKDKYCLVMVKCLFELGKYAETLSFLEPYVIEHAEDASMAEAFLLMSLSYQKTGQMDQFITYAEKTLVLEPEIAEKDILHLELYNAYLTLSLTEYDEIEKETLIDKAADHLFFSRAWEQKTIKLDNQLWLANHYYSKVKNIGSQDHNMFDRTLVLFKNLLGISDQDLKLQIASDSLFLEGEVLKFADLIGMKNDVEKQIYVLEALSHKQQEYPDLPWKLQRRTLLELALVYEKNQLFENAKKTYETIIATSNGVQSLVTNTAELHLARLEYSQIVPENKTSSNAQIILILQNLKDLQIQKNILGEPVHLEAALQYAEIRSDLEKQQSNTKGKLFFFKRMQDNFNEKDDKVTLEYHQMMQKYPEKEKIYQAYMNYVQAQIFKCEMELAKENNQQSDVLTFKRNAIHLIDELLKHSEDLKPYLLERVNRLKADIANENEQS